MKLQFKEQQFQIQAVKAVLDCFAGQPIQTNKFTLERSQELIRKAKMAAQGGQQSLIETENEINESIGYRNSTIKISDNQVLTNIRQIQQKNDLPLSDQLERPKAQPLGFNLTVEMETGTGKTYTYIRTMYELHKHYGWSKFIVIVPSIAIREGVYKSFQITQDHFQEIYGHKISSFIYNSSKPEAIESFASANRISVMIINTQAFNASGKDARRIYQELDQFQSRIPIEIIAQTNPILIIDEPQSVDGEKTLANMKDFNPLFTLRYSATHKVDYNQVYRLDALDAYNKKLVKKIQVKGINLKGTTGTNGYLYLESISLSTTKPPFAVVEYEKRKNDKIVRVREKLAEGANLYELSGNLPAYKNQTITEINGYKNKIVVNGENIFPGEVLNDKDEYTFRKVQIRETILSHLYKEKELFKKGIKVLSLFFIDSVDKYRQYTTEGQEQPGDYAKIFEEEYPKIMAEFLDDPNLDKEFALYLQQFTTQSIHQGYFSIDKKSKRLVDPTVKRSKEDSDDVSAYDLIMKDKERLLSFEEPTRFIFSHSALKEGWDNPNVFQICALKNIDSGSQTRRRQEVGRGMRLSVNKHGIRQDFELIGDEVHDINKLTVIASESYEKFAKGLQKEISDTLKNRPQKATEDFFAGKVVTDAHNNKYRITDEDARFINKLLGKADIIDLNDKITAEGIELIEIGAVPLPENLEPYKASVQDLLRSIYTSKAFEPEDERKNVYLDLNTNFAKQEFQELWSKISQKTVYEVNIDSDKLIQDSIARIDSDLHISDKFYEVKVGEQVYGEKEALDAGELIKETKGGGLSKVESEVYADARYDLIGELESKTTLTRKTLVKILQGISPDKFALFKKNPEEFIAGVSNLINEVKATLIINNIKYHKTDSFYDAKTIFTNDKMAPRSQNILFKHIYDQISSDADSKVEQQFIKDLENSTEVIVYAKLPKSFRIPTPIADFTPDWAIVFDKDKVRDIYFVAETKGSDSSLDLRGIEALKIHSAKEHFTAIGNDQIRFEKVSSYSKLLEIVKLK